MNPRIVRVDAFAIADGRGTCASPGSLLLEAPPPASPADVHVAPRLPVLLAAGLPSDINRHPAAADTLRLARPRHVLIPGLVNAHTHLDLSHIGPQPHDPGSPDAFAGWVDMIRARRRTSPADIAQSVQRGIDLCLAGGTVAVGDIAGAPAGVPSRTPFEVLVQSPLLGVSFLEFFAIGKGLERGLAAIAAALDHLSHNGRSGGIRVGLQPHAPTTVEPAGYAFAAAAAREHRLPLSTHLAETMQERLFIGQGSGPQREFLSRLGIWDDRLLAEFRSGLTPVGHLAPFLRAAPGTIVAHANDVSDADIEILGTTRAVVAYCPRASAYFGADRAFGPHRYRDMLAAGVRVALGTDSLVNLPLAAATPEEGGMSVLDEIRSLFRRDGTDATVLLAMATTAAADSLGLSPSWFDFSAPTPHPLAGVVAVPVEGESGKHWKPTEAVARSRGPVELLSNRTLFGPVGIVGS